MPLNSSSAQPVHRDVTFPVILIVLGVLLLLNEFVPGLGIDRTWPVILLALGVLLFLRSLSPPHPPRGPQI
jgi:membrane-bound ClpP family serine protease